ncbi:nuclear transport factor 2 family protein [Azospirillum halopraeferens]|uniref:nuclear transport factor 2 family protein n=1 Tax=Azospirillum halopraeferens TaxID=34010 RepID=UPI0004054601|nr:nuclear transport factor 2 family protein [Azospirillum halopraeferens]
MNDTDTLLTLNQAFYRAFADRNYAAMDALWARHLPVTCLHPGWMPLRGRDAVMQSWRDLLANPVPTLIRPRHAAVQLYTDSGLVICEEVLAESVLMASNLFVREDGAWRLAHHQSGPLAPQARVDRPRPPDTPPRRLH